MIRTALLTAYALALCLAEPSQQCAADGKCGQEFVEDAALVDSEDAEAMKVSLLQKRGKKVDLESGAMQEARLMQRKEELIGELSGIEKELQAQEPEDEVQAGESEEHPVEPEPYDEDKVWVATGEGHDLAKTKVLAPPASGAGVMDSVVGMVWGDASDDAAPGAVLVQRADPEEAGAEGVAGQGHGNHHAHGDGKGKSKGGGHGKGKGKSKGGGHGNREGHGNGEGKSKGAGHGNGEGKSKGAGEGTGEGKSEGAGEGEGEGSLIEEASNRTEKTVWQWGTADCAAYGCGSYEKYRNCQCNDKCKKYHSCCEDYETLCAKPTPAPTPGSCSVYKCGTYMHGRDCQCNKDCKKYDSCCSDYEDTCAGPEPEPTEPTPSGSTATPEPTPKPTPKPAGGTVKGVHGHPSASIDYPKYPGFTLFLAEEFDEPIDLDNDPIWTWSDGGLREGSVRFVKEQVKFKDGKMHLEVSNKGPFPKMESCSHASVETIPYKPLISGELRSRHNVFRYGRYEARIKAPTVQPGNPNVNGNFIATMFVYRDANAHHWREIDFEITADRPNSLTTNQLYADGTKNWKPYLQDSRQPYIGSVNQRSEFHVYAFEWTPSGVIWFVDGKEVRRGSRLHTPELSTKVMMNLWIFTGGHFGGHEIHNNRYPFASEYDYFRFYKWDGDDHYPCADMSTSCLTEDDMYLSANNPCDGIPQKGMLEGHPPCYAQCRK